MTKYLSLAIIAVCFYDALIMLLIPSTAIFILAADGSAAHLVAVLSALGIGLWVFLKDGYKALPNPWIAAFAFFMAFSAAHSPNIAFDSTFTPKDTGLFNYKPMFDVMAFLLMFMGVRSMKIERVEVDRLFNVLVWCACIYSAYILLQRFGVDQIYRLTSEISGLSRNPKAGGFIGQPVFAAAFLSLCLPFVYKTRNVWKIGVVIAAILATGNRSALIAASISFLILCKGARKYAFWLAGLFALSLVAAMVIYCIDPNYHPVLHDSGRLAAWKLILIDFLNPMFPGIDKSYIFTGYGIGAFSVMFPFYHHSGFLQAHNEFLEVFYGMSIGGLTVFVLMITGIFRDIQHKEITAGLLAITICAMTNAVWHIPQLQFMTVLLVGLGYNEVTKREQICYS